MVLRGSSDTNILVEKNRTVQRLAVNVRLGLSAASSITNRPLLKHVQMKCILRRDRKEHVIFNSNLQVLALESMYYQSCESLLHPSFLYPVVPGSTAWGQNLIVDLKSPINLKGDDELSLEISLSDAWLPPTATTGITYTPSACTIEVIWRETIGVETFIPVIRTKYIQAGIGQLDESLGDDITSVSFINTEGFPSGGLLLNDSTKIINTLQITSDRYNISDNFDRMIARRMTQFESSSTERYRYRSFVLIPEGECDQVKISLNMQAANVLVSENLLVWRTYIIDRATVERSAAMQAKHERRNTQKLAEAMSN